VIDHRHVHRAEHAIRNGTRTGNLKEVASLMLGHKFPPSSLTAVTIHIAFNSFRFNRFIAFKLLSTFPLLRTIVRPMKPVIPSDPNSLPIQTEAVADTDREESSLHGEILARLRDYVVEGNIPDGGRVPERQLCALFGISRTPLREALKVLASEGLVDLLPNRGARVRQLSERELAELFDVMGGLEGLAGRLACENISDQEIAEIERLHYEMYGFYLHRDMHGYFRVNQLIHQKIVEASRNVALLATYANFAGRIRRIRYSANFARKRERWGEAMREHEMILEALRRRAGSELSDILFHHLRNKRTAAIEHLNEADQEAKTAKPTLSRAAAS
jgi:DNA-binding GntR family transcriptional regulator